MTYAKDTSVSVEKTRSELDRLLAARGATQRAFGTDDVAGVAYAGFTMGGRQVRIRVPIESLEAIERRSAKPSGFWRRTEQSRLDWVRKEFNQRQRSRWRALLLLVKAKLEAIELGISTVEREFLADISLPDGRSVHQALAEDLERSYLTGSMPPLLGSGS